MGIESQSKVNSPRKAVFEVVQSLNDTLDTRAALIVSVHKTDIGSVGNIWERHGVVVRRVIPERAIPTKPHPGIILDEILRLVELTKSMPVGTIEYSKDGLLGLFHQAKEFAAVRQRS